DLARNTFPRLSFDLIYARPNQTPEAWGKELERAIGFAADHLSLYQLTIEPDTPFFKLFHAGKFPMPDEDTSVALYKTTHAICDAHGMPAYEISNHAREGAECRHNLIYWRYGEYAGIGPGAHGRLVSGNVRFATEMEKMPETWLDHVEKYGHGWILDDPLTLEQQGDEYLLMGLRLKEGIDLERFESLSQRTLDPGRLTDLVGHGMIEVVDGKRVRATREGFFVLDAVVADLAS
ncbi:MAG: coproporphyrinogen III oxidase, partial [Cohaesibacteraceae bacterium]|nr:coproporphyrinogen III oxidase [Cohaesibacteraceae bacterium]